MTVCVCISISDFNRKRNGKSKPSTSGKRDKIKQFLCIFFSDSGHISRYSILVCSGEGHNLKGVNIQGMSSSNRDVEMFEEP